MSEDLQFTKEDQKGTNVPADKDEANASNIESSVVLGPKKKPEVIDWDEVYKNFEDEVVEDNGEEPEFQDTITNEAELDKFAAEMEGKDAMEQDDAQEDDDDAENNDDQDNVDAMEQDNEEPKPAKPKKERKPKKKLNTAPKVSSIYIPKQIVARMKKRK